MRSSRAAQLVDVRHYWHSCARMGDEQATALLVITFLSPHYDALLIFSWLSECTTRVASIFVFDTPVVPHAEKQHRDCCAAHFLAVLICMSICLFRLSTILVLFVCFSLEYRTTNSFTKLQNRMHGIYAILDPIPDHIINMNIMSSSPKTWIMFDWRL